MVTQQKINRLLEELRSWAPGEERHTLRELSEKFDLEVFVVDRIAKSEGHDLRAGWKAAEEGEEIIVDPDSTTLNMDEELVLEALRQPDPDEAWTDEESGRWVKKPTTGEWVRLEDEEEEG